MAEEISLYAALLDPINGIDPVPPTQQNILNQINTGIPFKTLDYLYTNFRVYYPVETLTVLSVDIVLGSVSMSLFDQPYELLILSNSNYNALVTIQGSIGQSIQVDSVIFDVNLNINVPFDPYQLGITDVPVVTSKDFFIASRIFNILGEDTTNPSKSRDIIDSEGFVLTYNIDYVNSTIDLNIPYSTVFGIHFFGYLLKQASIMIGGHSSNATGYPENVGLTITVQKTNLEFQVLPDSGKIIDAKCDPAVYKGVATGLLIASVLIITLPVTVPSLFLMAQICGLPLKEKKPEQLTPSVKLEKIRASLSKDKYKVFMKAGFIDSGILLQPQPEVTTIQGPGTVEFVGTSTMYLTNFDVTVLGVNLVDVTPFPSESIMESSEYNLIQDNDSYNNSGSIFRRAHVITSNYTLTQFDGEVFLVDASAGSITITIPIGDISNNRLMEFKRIDGTNNNVSITSPGGIDGYKVYKLDTKKCKDGCKPKKLAYIRLFGDGTKLWILE